MNEEVNLRTLSNKMAIPVVNWNLFPNAQKHALMKRRTDARKLLKAMQVLRDIDVLTFRDLAEVDYEYLVHYFANQAARHGHFTPR